MGVLIASMRQDMGRAESGVVAEISEGKVPVTGVASCGSFGLLVDMVAGVVAAATATARCVESIVPLGVYVGMARERATASKNEGEKNKIGIDGCRGSSQVNDLVGSQLSVWPVYELLQRSVAILLIINRSKQRYSHAPAATSKHLGCLPATTSEQAPAAQGCSFRLPERRGVSTGLNLGFPSIVPI
jgi:hypothetical protein